MDDVAQRHDRQAAAQDAGGEQDEEDRRDVQSRELPCGGSSWRVERSSGLAEQEAASDSSAAVLARG